MSESEVEVKVLQNRDSFGFEKFKKHYVDVAGDRLSRSFAQLGLSALPEFARSVHVEKRRRRCVLSRGVAGELTSITVRESHLADTSVSGRITTWCSVSVEGKRAACWNHLPAFVLGMQKKFGWDNIFVGGYPRWLEEQKHLGLETHWVSERTRETRGNCSTS